MAKYEIKAENCNCAPNITYRRGDLTYEEAVYVSEVLACAFRQIDVLNQETGEVMVSQYVSCEFFKQQLTEAEAIATVEALF
jgi:hypothetical protein